MRTECWRCGSEARFHRSRPSNSRHQLLDHPSTRSVPRFASFNLSYFVSWMSIWMLVETLTSCFVGRLLLGPALLVYNDAVFLEQDFENIKSIGNSSKQEDYSKTGFTSSRRRISSHLISSHLISSHQYTQRNSSQGRFGLGFNSVYHLTDLPSIVSGPYYVILDPHDWYLSPACGGRRWDFLKGQLRDRCNDQLTPYITHEINFDWTHELKVWSWCCSYWMSVHSRFERDPTL